ncbi:PAS domain-containing protein [Bacteriovorax sp. Seq25_V]|uniref:PAS domain-containing protein n=1 Tax=Bacteriovorax sp. Seq25_V TaxID=1201288 RepID=UPI00038A28F6|nr:PAS domain-containing protein [Bacteriovorax sp. Seq25_V]EQC43725.1 putative blue-light photoreceptor [Bacteriovorax sp. Seq25_V]
MKSILDVLTQCGNEFDECFTIVDLEKEDSPLVYINSYFTEITGYTAAESINRNCRFLQGPGSDQEVTKSLKNSISKGICCWYDLINYKKDGTPFWNRLMLIPIEHELLGVRYFIGIQSDITEKKEKILDTTLTETIESKISTNEIEHNVSNPLERIFANIRSMQYFTDQESAMVVKEETKTEIKKIIDYIRSI